MQRMFFLSLLAITGTLVFAAQGESKRPSGPTAGATHAKVRVTMISDGETWVSITKVKQPAKLAAETVLLDPGHYEVVGRRKGYRDVATLLKVDGSTSEITLTIVCTETK